MATCTVCNGKGWVAYGPQTGGDQPKKTCPNCGGSGESDNSDSGNN